MLDWMWRRGWDEEFGGLFYFRDLHGKPLQEYWQDMKFWWPHNEAIIATLLAFEMTGDLKYARRHKLAHDWSFGYFLRSAPWAATLPSSAPREGARSQRLWR
jgi:N-acylglucosamine 2-epimerase